MFKKKSDSIAYKLLETKWPWQHLRYHTSDWNALTTDEFVALLKRTDGLEDIPLTYADLRDAFEVALHNPLQLAAGLAVAMRNTLAEREAQDGR